MASSSRTEEAVDIDIHPITLDRFEDFATVVESAFGSHPDAEELALVREVFEPDRSLAAFEGDRIVGGTSAVDLDLTVPGATMPMAGVVAVGVPPSHRRRGILTAMMRRQLDDFRDRGEALAGLWASEGAIYQRFGYGLATLLAVIEVFPHRSAFARPMRWRGAVSLVDRAQAMEAFPSVHRAVVERYPGMWPRTPARWRLDFTDSEREREGASALFFAVYESPEGTEGYVAYRVKYDWPQGLPSNEIRVRELMATTTEAYAALWRFCFDMDLAGRVTAWGRPADEPLLHMLLHPRDLRLSVGDGLWLRLVDVPAALGGRRYASESRLVMEVRDSFCPWNEGRYELDGGPDGSACRRTRRRPDLLVDVTDLSAVFLGGVRPRTLARAGRVAEAVPGALARADAMFGWDPPPWSAQVF